jgi:hypothetical protein
VGKSHRRVCVLPIATVRTLAALSGLQLGEEELGTGGRAGSEAARAVRVSGLDESQV